jgi:hypothetical protein
MLTGGTGISDLLGKNMTETEQSFARGEMVAGFLGFSVSRTV